MKAQILSASLLMSAVLATAATARAANTFTTNFDDLTLPASGYINGGPTDNSDGFSDGYVHFGNDFYGGYASGFSASNVSDTTTPGPANQYASYTGGGASGSRNYAIFFDDPAAYIDLPAGTRPVSFDLTNTTYAALSMKSGDQFAKKFGGPSGNDPDYLYVTITGYAGPDGGGGPTGSFDFYLADFRFADNALDYIVSTWTTVDLASLGNATSIGFSFTSSDVSFGFPNTPAYFALDNLVAIPEPTSLALAAVPLALLKRTRR